MLACLSGAAAFGGSVGVAKAGKFPILRFSISIVVGLLIGAFITWLIWKVGTKIFVTLYTHYALPETIALRKFLPAWLFILAVSVFVSGCVGGLLSHIVMRRWGF